jgi:hypothetical protein
MRVQYSGEPVQVDVRVASRSKSSRSRVKSTLSVQMSYTSREVLLTKWRAGIVLVLSLRGQKIGCAFVGEHRWPKHSNTLHVR